MVSFLVSILGSRFWFLFLVSVFVSICLLSLWQEVHTSIVITWAKIVLFSEANYIAFIVTILPPFGCAGGETLH